MRYVAALVLFLLVTGLWFHAVVLHPTSRIPGGIADGTGAIRQYWAASAQHRTPFNFTHDALVGAPQGRTEATAIELANGAVQTAFVWGLRGPLGLVGAWNLFAFLGLIGTAMAMFALLQRLGCTFGASMFGGYVLAFSPYSFERALAGHIAFLHSWIFVVLVAALIRLRDRRAWLSAVAVGVAIGFSFYFTAYDALFAALMLFVFVLVEFQRLPLQRLRSLALGGVALLVSFLVLVPVLVAWSSESQTVQSEGAHAGSDFYTFAASMSAYLIPSPRNPFFHWLRNVHPTDLMEQTLYFGYLTVALALVGVVLLRRHNSWFDFGSRRWTAIYFAALAPAAFVLSLPPSYRAGKVVIPMPSLVLALATNFWRVYSRFGLIAGLALAALAAMSLSALAERGGRGWRLLAPAALVFVAFFELVPGNIKVFNTSARPDWVAWLAVQPRGIVATYPAVIGGTDLALAQQDLWYQTFDKQPRFAYSGLSYVESRSRANAIRLIARRLQDPQTARLLATEGVRYVVVHRDVYHADHHLVPALDRPVFVPLKRFGDVRIYSVKAPRISIDAVLARHALEIGALMGFKPLTFVFGHGFSARQVYRGSSGRWLAGTGRLEVTNVTGASFVTITGRAVGDRRSRLLEVADGNGRVLARQRISTKRVALRLGPFRVPAGAFTLRLMASPKVVRAEPKDNGTKGIFLVAPTLSPVPDSIEPLLARLRAVRG